MFEEIKKVSSQVSRKAAMIYLQEVNKQCHGEEQATDNSHIWEMIQSLAKKHEIFPQYGPIRSGVIMPDGRSVEFLAFTQSFYKPAQILTEFLTELSSLFTIEANNTGKLTIRSSKPSDKIHPCSAGYFVQGETTFAVDLSDGKVIKINGYQKAGGGRDPDGNISVEVNMDYDDVTIEDLIHELVHAKLPDSFPQYDAPHYQFVDIASEIQKRLKIQMRSPISEIDSLMAERLRIQINFTEFDQDIRKSEKKLTQLTDL